MANGKTNLSVSKRREEMRKKKGAQRRRRNMALAVLLGIVVIAAGAYFLTRSRATVDPTANEIGDRPLTAIEPAARENYYSEFPPLVIDTAKSYEAVIVVEGKGEMHLALFDDEAPQTVNNFVFLANEGYYDGLQFHRVIDDFMAQGGDPTGSGSGGPGYNFGDETDTGRSFDRRGLLAMANAGPNTNGSQFFITFLETPWLDGGHTIFGELIAGDDVLSSLTIGDIMEQIIILEK